MARLAPISARNSNSPSGRGTIGLALLLQHSPFLRFMDACNAFEEDSTTFDFWPVNDTATLQTRAIGGGYTATDMTLPNKISNSLKFYGDGQDWDVTYDRDKKLGLTEPMNLFEKKLKKKMQDWAKKMQVALFNDDGTGNKLKGYSKLLNGTDVIAGSTETRVFNAASYAKSSTAKYFDLSGDLTDAKASNFIEMFMQLLAEIDNPQGMILNRSTAARINAIGYKKDVIGVQQYQSGMIQTFMNMPMIIVDDNTIGQAEPDDTATPVACTTSIYLMSPAEQSNSIVTNSGLAWLDIPDLEDKSSQRERWEFALNIKFENEKSVLRLRNIKLS